MRKIKIALANLDPTVGAFRTNTDRIIEHARRMAEEHVTVGCFAEQAIAGYPSEDLVLWEGFVEQQWEQLRRFAAATKMLGFPTVYSLGLAVRESDLLYNSVACVCAGEILGIVPKEKLPTYGVFYEGRVFAAGQPGRVSETNGVPFGDLIFQFPFGVLSLEVCEDIWTPEGPMRRRTYSGAELVVNVSASPWRAGVLEQRREMLAVRAQDNQATVVYVNQLGANDSLVYDGGGFVQQDVGLMLEAPRWKSGIGSVVVDLERVSQGRRNNSTWRSECEEYLRTHERVHTVVAKAGPEANHASYVLGEPLRPVERDHREQQFEDLLAAMKLGLAGYFEKTGAFERIGIALSGGKDSVVTLIVAWLYAKDRFKELMPDAERAALREFIHCFSMPTRFNSENTKTISRRICVELGVTFGEVPIEDAFEREVKAAQQMLGSGQKLSDLTVQNIQARLRGMRMWNWANSSRALWLQTGNMSEKAVGYTTVGGDLMGAYSLIGNLPKTTIIALLYHLHKKLGLNSLQALLASKASAELAENQEDERDLMPFEVLDACFELFAGEKLMPVDVYRTLRARFTDEELRALAPNYVPGMLKEWVMRFVLLFVKSIFKWVQAPQAVHLLPLDLDRERALQLPVVQSLEWLRLEDLDEA
jgi:NAD+ synthase (glutamine-hydrolysing)